MPLRNDHRIGKRRSSLFTGDGTSSITLATADARLRIDVWTDSIFQYPSVADDTMILACAVIITNRRYDAELNAANLVY